MNLALSEGLNCGSAQSFVIRAGVTNGVNDETASLSLGGISDSLRAQLEMRPNYAGANLKLEGSGRIENG